MDLFIATLIGAAVMGGIVLLVSKIRKWRRRVAIRNDAATIAQKEIERKQEELLETLRSKHYDTRTYEGFTNLLHEIARLKDDLNQNDSKWLYDDVKQNANIMRVLEPKLEALQNLQQETNEETLFANLHIVRRHGSDTLPSWHELTKWSDRRLIRWVEDTYERLLLDRLRTLILASSSGSIADFNSVMELWKDLKDWSNSKGEDRQDLVISYLFDEWTEMILRFKQIDDEIDWDNDLFTLQNMERAQYDIVVKKAFEGGDYTSSRIMLMGTWSGDAWFDQAMKNYLTDKFKHQVDAQRPILTLATE